MKSSFTTHFSSSKPTDIYDGHDNDEVGDDDYDDDDDDDDDDKTKLRHQTTLQVMPTLPTPPTPPPAPPQSPLCSSTLISPLFAPHFDSVFKGIHTTFDPKQKGMHWPPIRWYFHVEGLLLIFGGLHVFT